MRAKLANVKRGPLAVTLAVLVLVIAFFGVLHTQGIGPGAPTFTSLQVVREGYAPLQKTITDTDAIARLYDAAQRLTRIPPGGECNPGPFLAYHLTFMRGGSKVARIDIYPLGNYPINACSYLIFEPGEDERALTLGFVHLAATTFGIPALAPTAGTSNSS